jgi:hypothetical protein
VLVAVVGAFLMFFGFSFVAVAVIMVVLRWSDQRLLRRLRRSARLALGELSNAASLPRWVLITARTAAGPDGILTSPAFETRCVWYRTSVTSAEHDDYCYLDRSSGGPAIIVTDGTGSVQVDLGLILKVSSHERVQRTRAETLTFRRGSAPPDHSRFAILERKGLLPDWIYPRFGSRRVDLVEETIAADVELSVVAKTRRLGPGVVILRRRGAVSAGAPADWIARLERDVVTAFWTALAFPAIGLALGGLGLVLVLAGAS